MSARVKRITLILLWSLTLITGIFAVLFYFGPVMKGTEGTRFEEPTITNTFLIFSYILLGLTVIITVAFSIRGLILNPKGIKTALFALGAGIVLVVIASLIADDSVLNLPHYKGNDNVPRTLLWTDIGLYIAYFLAVIAILAIIYSEITRLLRK